MKWHSLKTVKSYSKWIQFSHILLFSPSCCTNMFFTAPALLLRFTFFCVGIFIGNFPEIRYFSSAFYRYFWVILDSVIFLRPWWQPWKRRIRTVFDSCPIWFYQKNSFLYTPAHIILIMECIHYRFDSVGCWKWKPHCIEELIWLQFWFHTMERQKPFRWDTLIKICSISLWIGREINPNYFRWRVISVMVEEHLGSQNIWPTGVKVSVLG